MKPQSTGQLNACISGHRIIRIPSGSNCRLNRIPHVLLLSFLASLTACGGGGGSGSTTQAPAAVQDGYFIDAAVAGLEYRTASQSGITDSDGRFQYRAGEEIAFFLGELHLGTANAASIMTPVDIAPEGSAPTSAPVVNRLRLLQGLDSDSDPKNGISIAPETRTAMGLEYARWIDLDTKEAAFEVQGKLNEFLDNQALGLRNRAAASEHFTANFMAINDFSGEWSRTLESVELASDSSNFCMAMRTEMVAWISDDTQGATILELKDASLWMRRANHAAIHRMSYDDPDLGFRFDSVGKHRYRSDVLSQTNALPGHAYTQSQSQAEYTFTGPASFALQVDYDIRIENATGEVLERCEYVVSYAGSRVVQTTK